jgi:hypothetical protein
MKFEEIQGWKLLQSDDDRSLARMWLGKVCRELQIDDVGKALGSIRSTCIRAEIDEEAGRIAGEFETAYAVRLTTGQIVCGIAPTSRSAAYRTRRLLRHGHCRAAGVPQHLS